MYWSWGEATYVLAFPNKPSQVSNSKIKLSRLHSIHLACFQTFWLCAHSPDRQTYQQRSTAPPPCWRTPGPAWKPSQKQTEGKPRRDNTPQTPGSSAESHILSALSHQQFVSWRLQKTSGTLWFDQVTIILTKLLPAFSILTKSVLFVFFLVLFTDRL